LNRPSRPAAYRLSLRLLLVSLAVGTGCGCKKQATPPPPGNTAVAVVTLGGKPFNLEIAASDEKRQYGLMHRDALAADGGMVFVFPRESQLSFWMHNTRIPLDILYLDANGVIVTIKQMEPYNEDGVPTDKPAKYAIELNRGTAAQLGLKVGDQVVLPPAVQNPPDLQ
jgi:uncharacterized membrane protein (UPF0127 family)